MDVVFRFCLARQFHLHFDGKKTSLSNSMIERERFEYYFKISQKYCNAMISSKSNNQEAQIVHLFPLCLKAVAPTSPSIGS